MKRLYASHRLSAFAVLVFVGMVLGLAACAVTLQAPPPASAPAQQDAWQTYTSADAAYAFDYPAGATIETSDDASLRYKLVYVQFPVTETTGYQGASVMVIEDPDSVGVRGVVASRYAEAAQRMTVQAQNAAGFQVNGREAIKLERDAVVGDLDKYTVLVEGDGVIYRLNLFGGGKGGEVEPPPEVEATFDRLVKSFRVLNQPLQPKLSPSLASGGGGFGVGGVMAEPPVATVFTYPLRSGAGVNYGVPTGIVVGGTRMEWLDYAIRNLDQWRLKCYGVDWTRMIHTGEDWYRDDYLTANSAGTPVYAVADGVVELHNPGLSYPGNVVIIRHRLPDGRNIYSMYGHVANVSVAQGQQVARGQQIATIFNQGYVGRTPNRHTSWDAHLHFEMRWFRDGTNIYVPSTNAYGYNYPACTYAYPGRGYTYIIHPDDYPYPGQGYVDGSDFIAARLQEPVGCSPTQLVQNGGFESGTPGTPWAATNSLNRLDPLIYKTRPRTGRWGGWLGNVVNYQDTLAQVIQVPANTATATLTFWRYVQSYEPAGNGDDRMTVSLTAPNGSAVGAPLVLTTATARNRWVQESVTVDLSGYAFPTATLSLTGLNDANNKSSFFLDDVSLVRTCASAAGLDSGVETRHGASLQITDAELVPAVRMTETAPFTSTVYLPVIESEIEPLDKDLALQATCTNVLANGSFEDASSQVWTGIANTGSTIYNVIPNGASSGVADPLVYTTRPRTGARSGRVGSTGVNGYWNELVQTVQLPTNVTSVTLTYWRYLDTQEASTTTALDIFKIGLETEKGIEIAKPQQIDNRSAGRGQWVQESYVVANANAWSSQKLWVTFKGQLDGARPSALYVDDAELSVCAVR
jgi:murein DD-endopeptidase MepM/ murein hydrolase activator NlpD